jgi:hypothetical protein
MNAPASPVLAHRVRRLAHLDLPGAGQVVAKGGYTYVGHMKPPHGTTILDVSDPRRPRVVAALALEGGESHSHKVRVAGDLMLTNVEHNDRRKLRRARRVRAARAQLREASGREPAAAEVAARAGVRESEVAELEAYLERPYRDGGFKVWDIADRSRPRLLCHARTGGCGVHRFDADERYAYISTEMEGYRGNILVIYDLRDPHKPEEVSRWWLPGQHLAGGETPQWEGESWRLHHALRCGDQLWAGCWYAGLRVIDISDIRAPRTVGAYNYHPPYPEPTHTAYKVPFALGGRTIALAADEEHEHVRGQPHAFLWILDVADLSAIRPLATFHVSELDSPWSRAPGRFGAHQFQEHLESTLVCCAWFAGGLRIVDIADPAAPREAGWFIPEPCGGNPSPQSNDVDVDERGLVYLVDRHCGFDILELEI